MILRLSDWDFTQILAPRACLHCGRGCRQGLCRPCLALLEPQAVPGCRRCGNPAVHADAADCSWCRRLKVLPDRIYSHYLYRRTGRELFAHLKFEGYWRLLRPLFQTVPAPLLAALPLLDCEALVPIPEAPSRRTRRHFNPAALIAREIGGIAAIPVREALGVRWFGRRQVGLDLSARRRNMRDRFRLRGKLPGRTLLLVDDVLTTGATLEAATRVLRRNGAERVYWFTLFRTP